MKALSACSACIVVVLAPRLDAQTTTRASVSSSGVPAAIAYLSGAGGLSSDGRFVSFTSSGPNLVPGDTNGAYDAFVHDRVNGVTTRVSLSSSNAQANGSVSGGAISSDGRFIVMSGVASNLVNGDSNNVRDVFLRDQLLGLTTRVSCSTSGVQANAESNFPLLTPDGAWVAFSSAATNLDPLKTTSISAPFVHEVPTGTTLALPLAQAGAQLDGFVSAKSISSAGRYIMVEGYATNIVAGDTNGAGDAFVHDRVLGTTIRVSVNSAGIQGNGNSFAGGISDDGRYAVFSSSATNLVPGDVNSQSDIFLRDLQLGTTSMLSVNSSGIQGNHWSDAATITPDGRFVAFSSWSTNLVPGDNNNAYDQFRLDRQSNALVVFSVGTLGQFANGNQGPATTFKSDDGKVLAFSGYWAGIVPTQIYSNDTVYVHDFTVFAPVTTYCTAKINSLGCQPEISSAGVPRSSGGDVFFLVANNLRSNKPGVFLWSRVPSAAPFGGGTLCLSAPVTRTGIQSSGVAGAVPCSGTYSFHFRQNYMSTHGLVPGDTIYGQFYSRDPGFAAPNDIGLTDAVQFGIIP